MGCLNQGKLYLTMKVYLAAISASPLLTPEREFQLKLL